MPEGPTDRRKTETVCDSGIVSHLSCQIFTYIYYILDNPMRYFGFMENKYHDHQTLIHMYNIDIVNSNST